MTIVEAWERERRDRWMQAYLAAYANGAATWDVLNEGCSPCDRVANVALANFDKRWPTPAVKEADRDAADR
jgi:hypothetical protein